MDCRILASDLKEDLQMKKIWQDYVYFSQGFKVFSMEVGERVLLSILPEDGE